MAAPFQPSKRLGCVALAPQGVPNRTEVPLLPARTIVSNRRANKLAHDHYEWISH